jgi:hypothetical protein
MEIVEFICNDPPDDNPKQINEYVGKILKLKTELEETHE